MTYYSREEAEMEGKISGTRKSAAERYAAVLRGMSPKPLVSPPFELKRVRLNRGGYSPGKYGQYFGTLAPPLYEYWGEAEKYHHERGPELQPVHGHVRAENRALAKLAVLTMYPSARFFR